MSIKHCVIHSLKRSVEGGEIKAHLKEQALVAEGAIVSLFTQLKQNFQRSATRQYGLFDPEKGDNPNPGWLKQFESESMSFITVTKSMTEHLKSTLEEIKDGFSTHILYVVEELLEERQLYIFWLTHAEAQFIDSELEVDTLEYVESGRLNHVMKLDFNQWNIENWQQYLTVITGRGNKEISDAFVEFCGFVSSVNLQQQTSEFLSIVEDYANTLTPDEGKICKNKIVEYCVEQDMKGNAVNINSLSEELNADQPDRFSEFVREKQDEPKDEIYAHRNTLKKFVRFYGREKDLSISFSSDMMGDNVVFNPDTGELILKSPPKSLLQQLSKYLKKD